MKQYLVLFFIFSFLIVNAQLSIIPNYSWNKDKKYLHNTGVRLFFTKKIKEKIDISGGVNFEYALEKESKSKYYDNYLIGDLNVENLLFVKHEHYLPLEAKLRTFYISPEFLFQYQLTSKRLNIYLFSGLIFKIQIANNDTFTQVDYYNTDLTEYAINTYNFKNNKLQFYNWYLPLGVNIKLGKLPILMSMSYGFALNRKSLNPIAYYREKRHNNINLGIGFSL